MEQPFILCGLGRIGWRVLEYLQAADLPVVVVDTRCAADDPRLGKARLVQGDCRRREVLQGAGVPTCAGVLIMTNDDLINISAALMIRSLHPDVRVVMRMFNENLVARLGKAVNNVFALSTSALTAPLFALSALTGQALGTLRIEGIPDSLRQIAEVNIRETSPLHAKQVGAIGRSADLLVVAHRPGGGKDRFLLEVDQGAGLQSGDRVIVCGQPEAIAGLLEEEGNQVLPHVRWAGWLRRMGRVVWRTFSEIELPVKVCAAILFAVIILSSAVFYESGKDERLDHAFYRTISLMATAADMHRAELHEAWLVVFASVLRVAGAALIAAFTAIVTNYLLRARLAGALEIRRIPDSGHVVVCGLGNIGFRVVEELVKHGERVVVIEQARDSRFVTTARRLGVAVLIGDATVSQVLRQAHTAQAKAVIATTSDDLINLEIALMVRDLQPAMRVVLHLSDPNLAQTLREAANIRLALSIPTLAAPAFLAALFGDRVQSVFMIDGRLLAALDLVIPPQDACLIGQTVRAVAVDYGLLPVAVLDSRGKLHPRPMSVRLDAGYRLVGITVMADLERLLRREPARKEYAVDITGFLLPSRPWLASLVRVHQGISAEDAESSLERLPLCLAADLTRGQAEDILVLLEQQCVRAALRRKEDALASA